MLLKAPRVQAAKPLWLFSKKNVHWLYDEFDVDARGNQRHEVLLSDGRILTIDFVDMQLITSQKTPAIDAA